MKTILLSLLVSIMRRYVGTGVFDRVAELVRGLMSAEMSGAEKRAAVQDALIDEAQTIGSIAINAAIEVAVLKESSQG